MSWRSHVEKHPVASLTVAVGVGVLAAIATAKPAPMLQPPRQPAERSVARELSARGPESWVRKQGNKHLERLSDTLENIFSAVIGVAANRLTHFMDELLPGFNGEFEKSARDRVPSVPTIH